MPNQEAPPLPSPDSRFPGHHTLLPPRADSTFPALFLPYDTHSCRERWNRHRHPPENME